MDFNYLYEYIDFYYSNLLQFLKHKGTFVFDNVTYFINHEERDGFSVISLGFYDDGAESICFLLTDYGIILNSGDEDGFHHTFYHTALANLYITFNDIIKCYTIKKDFDKFVPLQKNTKG